MIAMQIQYKLKDEQDQPLTQDVEGDPKYSDEQSLDCVKKVGTRLSLLAKNGDVEIIRQVIAAGRPFTLTPGPGKNFFEFIYVLSGRFLQTDSNREFGPHDYIIAEDLDHKVYFHTLTEVTLLCVSNQPVFQQQKKKISKLNSILESIDQEGLSYLINMACKLGFALGLDDEQVFQLSFAVALHDLCEQSNHRANSIISNELIAETLDETDYERVAEIIVQHYERHDGKGHPYGLTGDDILIEAQILAVIDAYNTLMKLDGLCPAAACRYLEREKGFAFSPRVVDEFLKIEKNVRKEEGVFQIVVES